ncbi:MAG: 1-acyl-sn-glycerol-3-phosphate acyltransferase [Clostridia bacterium]|nr:1-acyl-sn-glycerol-3-phosphate acyltransferase [Clostridia bacterium]
MKRLFRIFLKVTSLWTMGLFFLPRIRHESKENRQSTFAFKGPAIIVSNHTHFLDFILIMFLFAFRYIRCVVGKTLYESSKLMTTVLKLLGAIKVDRFSFDMQFFYECTEFLQKKGVVLIFPEGRLSRDGTILPFKSSVVLMAIRTGVDIIPIYHTHKYGFMKPTGVMVGDRINLRQMCNNPNPGEEELTELTLLLENKIKGLRDLYEQGGGVR